MSATPIGLFVGSWLNYSETFIYDQIVHQQRFCATVFCRELKPGAVRFPYDKIVALPPAGRLRYLLTGEAKEFHAGLERCNAQLIHAHFGLNGALAAAHARAAKIPLAVTFHGHDVGGLFARNKYKLHYLQYQRRAPQMFEQASLLICASQELADQLLQLGAPAEKLVVHRLGIDLTQFTCVSCREGEPTVLMVGRMVEKKGMSYGLEAFARVHKNFPNLRLKIIGDGPLKRTLQKQVSRLGLQHAVTLLGVLPAERVREQMQACHVLMAPSVVAKNGDRESGVIVLKEAAACGLACIGSRHGGIPEIIEHEQTGLLARERDVEDLARHLHCLLSDAELRAAWGLSARRKMEREYDTVIQNKKLEDLLVSIL